MADENIVDKLVGSNADNKRKSVKDRGDVLEKQKTTLTAQEKTRITNETTVFAKEFLKIEKQMTPDEKGETARADKTTAGKVKSSIEKAKEDKPPKLKFPLLLALGAGITAFAAWIADFIGPVAEFVAKTLPKLLKPMGKLASNFFKAMKGGKLAKILASLAKGIGGRLLKFGRFIPVIGSLFSFGFGIARWKKGEYIPAIFEFASGILNLLPFGVTNIASMIIDGALLLYDLNKAKKEKEGIDPTGGQFDMWGKIKDFAVNLPGIQNIISLGKGIGAVFKGEWAEAGKHFLEAIPVVGNIIYWLAKAGDGSVAEGTGKVLGKAGDFFASVKDKFVEIFKNIINSIVEGLQSFGNKFLKVGSGVKAAFKALAPGGESPIEAFKRVVYADDFARFNDGTIVKFNQKDDILGMKQGGALSKMFNSVMNAGKRTGSYGGKEEGSKITSFIRGIGRAGREVQAAVLGEKHVYDKFVVSEIQQSNKFLEILVRLTAQLVDNNQGTNNTPIIMQNQGNNDMSGSMQGPGYADAKSNFLNSTYRMQPG